MDEKLGTITLCFKCPDTVDFAVNNYVQNKKDIFIENGGKSYEFDEDGLLYNVRDKIRKFVKWDEVISVEINLDNNTAKVIKNE